MNKEMFSTRIKIFVAIMSCICLISVTAVGYLCKTIMTKNQQLRLSIIAKDNEIQNINNIINKIKHESHAKDINTCQYNETFLAKPEQMPEFLSSLGDALKTTHLKLLSFIPMSLQDDKINNIPLKSLTISMQLKGDYAAHLAYLKKILDIPFLVEIKNFNFKKDPSGPVILNLELKSYYI